MSLLVLLTAWGIQDDEVEAIGTENQDFLSAFGDEDNCNFT
jgi:hypothetical protein